MSDTHKLAARLHSTTDAAVWAEEFVAMFGTETIDFGLMVGWFANAIEIGRDAGRADSQAEIADGYEWMDALVRQSTDPGAGALAWLHRNRRPGVSRD